LTSMPYMYEEKCFVKLVSQGKDGAQNVFVKKFHQKVGHMRV